MLEHERLVCDGCGHAITMHDKVQNVDLHGILKLHFHQDCYVAALLTRQASRRPDTGSEKTT